MAENNCRFSLSPIKWSYIPSYPFSKSISFYANLRFCSRLFRGGTGVVSGMVFAQSSGRFTPPFPEITDESQPIHHSFTQKGRIGSVCFP